MEELIDISNEKFWDILFDEACVEGQQAKRIETALKQIATTEAEIRASAIDEFANRIKCEFRIPFELVDEIAEQLKGE